MGNISKWFKRSMHVSLALLLAAILGVGLTVAYFTDVEGALNRVMAGEIEITVDETIDGLNKENILAEAVGTSDAWVRMRADIPTIKYSYLDGETLKEGQAVITIGSTEGSKEYTAAEWSTLTELPAEVRDSNGNKVKDATWKKETDGFWYLSTTLSQGQSAKFIDKITYPGLWVKAEGAATGTVVLPDGVTKDMLAITITSEAVQKIDGIDNGPATFQAVDGATA